MDSNNKLVKYKEETIFTIIKKQILNLFHKKETLANEDFATIYAKVKRHEIDLNSLDKKTLDKVIKTLDEEIELTSRLLESNTIKNF